MVRIGRLTLSLVCAMVLCAPKTVSAAEVRAVSCAKGGRCAVGNIGPGGGRIVVASSTPQWWGSYIEARPLKGGRGLPWSLRPTESVYSSAAGDVLRQRIDARGWGMGAMNTQVIVQHSGEGAYAAKKALDTYAGGKNDWFLPSRDELDSIYHLASLTTWRGMYKEAYWSSSENSTNFAWYQMFQDGTQFTDEHGIGKIDDVAITSNKDKTRNTKHGGSGFRSLPFRLVVVRYFGPIAGSRNASTVSALTGRSCTASGPCSLGDLGPGGGIVFYDAGEHKTWGRYLEMAPASTEVAGLPWKNLSVVDKKRPLYVNTSRYSARVQRIIAKRMGMGRQNTRLIVRKYGVANYAARYAADLVFNGHDDWFLPSEDELNEMYKFAHVGELPLDGTKDSFYWSSSEYDFNNAWTVNFKDGQQFDREKYNVPTPTVKALRVRAVRAFG